MRKIQVGERLPLLSSASSLVSWATVLMSARIMFWGASNAERHVLVLQIARVFALLVITAENRDTSMLIVRN